ncbi:MAG: ATP-grasp domain-containing protein [Pirellulaceae bacterium]
MAAQHTNFFPLDLAETEAGSWILIELNDGQSTGPCDNDLDELYGNLRDELR